MDHAIAQSISNSVSAPEVFLIGEHEDKYMALSKQHPAIFASIYQNDIDRAFRGYADMLMDMEDYADRIRFDIKGVKLWFNIYFNADGTIQHLAFFPKPNSRNVPEEHLVAFFRSFVQQYRLPVTAEKNFQHSASAAFPTFFHREQQPSAKRD